MKLENSPPAFLDRPESSPSAWTERKARLTPSSKYPNLPSPPLVMHFATSRSHTRTGLHERLKRKHASWGIIGAGRKRIAARNASLENWDFLASRPGLPNHRPQDFPAMGGPLTRPLDCRIAGQIMGFRALSMSRSGASFQPCSVPPSAATRSLSYVVPQICIYLQRVVCDLYVIWARAKTLSAVAGPFFFVANPMTSVAQHP